MQCQKGLNRVDGNGSDSGTLWIARLVFGLSLYMDAFPETVVHAGNDDVHHIRHYDGPRHIVARNAVVDEERRQGVSPHWRRGHFRLLASARFVHKQGQTVYVRGTFVKGQAFDVLEEVPSVEAPTYGHRAEDLCPACAI